MEIQGKFHRPAVDLPSLIRPDLKSLQRNQALLAELLMKQIAQRDESALGELYDHTSPIIFGLILWVVGDRGTAEEVTLDVYSQVWKHAHQYDAQRGTPLTWLMVLGRSRALDSLRSRGSRESARGQPLDATTEFADPAPNPEEESVDSERSRVVQTALTSLTPKQRQAIELAFFGGLSHGEIATRLAQPLGTVKTRIRLGMLRLRDVLHPYADAI